MIDKQIQEAIKQGKESVTLFDLSETEKQEIQSQYLAIEFTTTINGKFWYNALRVRL